MSEFDDIDGEDSDGAATEPAPGDDNASLLAPDAVCLSCGAGVAGVFCVACGQKQDDLRRSLLVLARDFIEDTFAFDSRMWRTLGLLATSPGVVPTDYSHGRRARYTPPVRLFLVVSFLFFLSTALTKTLFVGLDVQFTELTPAQTERVIAILESADVAMDPDDAEVDDATNEYCSFRVDFRLLIKESDLKTDKDRLETCFNTVSERSESDAAVATDADDVNDTDDQNEEIFKRLLEGINWAIGNPQAFNAGVNDWLPRVMFLMTPVLALILALFLRRNAIIFDHMVLSLYVHAVNFAVVGASLMLAQLGAPLVGLVGFFAVAIYYVVAIKRAYGRGWVKTIWTAAGSTILYLVVLAAIMLMILSRTVWQATA